MSQRRARVPGMAGPSFAIPRCSVHQTGTVRDPNGGWICPTCVDEFTENLEKSGKESAAKRPTFAELLPNRRARRAVMHS